MESYADYDSSGDWRSSGDFKFPVAARRHYHASSSSSSSRVRSSGSVSGSRLDEVKTGNEDDSDYDLDEIKYEDIIFGDKIGEGAFGEVFRGTVYGQDVALKRLRMNPQTSPQESATRLREFVEEIKIMKTLRHPNIVAFLGACYREPRLCIVTEFLEGGNLEDYMTRQREAGRIPPLTSKRALKIAKDIARGLNWLHHKGVIHRDLKSANILLDRNHNVKIADFGLAHIKNRMSSQKTGFYGIVGTPCYMAPEVLKDSSYGVKADVFSFSIVLCELVAGEYPYKDGSAPEATNDFERAIITGLRPVIPSYCHPSIARLITDCWAEDPDLRPDMDEVMRRLDEIQRNAFPVSSNDALEEAPAEVVQIVEDSKKRIEELESKLRNAQLALHSERSLRQQLESSIKEPSKGNRRSPHISTTVPTRQIPALPPTVKAPPPRGPPPPNPNPSHNQPVRTLLTTRAVAQMYLPSNEATAKNPPQPHTVKKVSALEAEIKVAPTTQTVAKAVPPTISVQDLYRNSPSPQQLQTHHAPGPGRAPLPRTSPELNKRNPSPVLASTLPPPANLHPRQLPAHSHHHNANALDDDGDDYDDDEDYKGFHDSSDDEEEDYLPPTQSQSSTIPSFQPQPHTGTVIHTPQDAIRPRPPVEDPPLKAPQPQNRPPAIVQPPNTPPIGKPTAPKPVQTKKLSIFGKLLGRKEKAPEPASTPSVPVPVSVVSASAAASEVSEDAESHSIDDFLRSA